MGWRNWWRDSRERVAGTRRSLAIDDDQELISTQVPELVGMSDVQGMAYVLAQIQEWNSSCTKAEATAFAGRLLASNDAWTANGMTMPYWGNLWVLRTYQRELGYDVPRVAPPIAVS